MDAKIPLKTGAEFVFFVTTAKFFFDHQVLRSDLFALQLGRHHIKNSIQKRFLQSEKLALHKLSAQKPGKMCVRDINLLCQRMLRFL